MSFPELIRLEGVVVPDNAKIMSLKVAGAYDGESDYAKQYITDGYFNVTVHGPRKLSLAHFNRVMTGQHVEEVAKEMGYEVALVEDLLSVGAHSRYRELQRQFLIVALGSYTVVDDERDVPCLHKCPDKRYLFRYLCLGLFGSKWPDDCRFLFVDNSTVA